MALSPLVIIALGFLVHCVCGCNVSVCIDNGQGTVPVSNATGAYYKCLDNAKDVQAFRCRCTLKIRDCLYDPLGANCSRDDEIPLDACSAFVVDQNWMCSATLCSNAAVLSPLALSLAVAVITVLMFV